MIMFPAKPLLSQLRLSTHRLQQLNHGIAMVCQRIDFTHSLQSQSNCHEGIAMVCQRVAPHRCRRRRGRKGRRNACKRPCSSGAPQTNTASTQKQRESQKIGSAGKPPIPIQIQDDPTQTQQIRGSGKEGDDPGGSMGEKKRRGRGKEGRPGVRGEEAVRTDGRTNLLVSAGEALADDLALEGPSLVEGEVLVVLRQPRLALLVDEQHEPDRHPALGLPDLCCSRQSVVFYLSSQVCSARQKSERDSTVRRSWAIPTASTHVK